MKTIAPNYYTKFHCIADKCHHSCCIGWEIDIDEDTLDFYQSIGGDFGNKLREHIENDGESTHFCLVGKEERCPFLKENGLCEMILTLGEDALCDICREHPRFYHVLSDRDEVGLGLCCEEAARLILSQEEDTVLEIIDDDGEKEALTAWETKLFSLREQLFDILQNREKTLDTRAQEMLTFSHANFPSKTPSEWCDIFLSLEQLDPTWKEGLEGLRHLQDEDFSDFEKPFEKLLLYFLYRHTAEAQDKDDFSARVAFAYLGYHIIRLLCAAKKAGNARRKLLAYLDFPHLQAQQNGEADPSNFQWHEKTQNDVCAFHDLLELARRYSSEIEYSEENTDTLLNLLR